MSCRAVTLVALAVSLVVPIQSSAASPPIEVTTCGQVVTGSNAVLPADLVCPKTVGSLLCSDTYCTPTKRSGSCQISNGTITNAKYAIAARHASTFGVYGRVIRLFGSSVSGRLDNPRCGTQSDCAGLLSITRPLLDATSSCERSMRSRSGPGSPIENWGVCTLD